MFAEDISEDFSDLTFTGFYSISGYLRNLRERLLSSEKFPEVFTLWVFTLKPFPAKTLQVIHLTCSPENSSELLFGFACGFGIDKWRGFLVNFLWSPSPRK